MSNPGPYLCITYRDACFHICTKRYNCAELIQFLPLSFYCSLELTKISKSQKLTNTSTDNSNSNVHLTSSIDTIHAGSFDYTPPLLYSPVKSTKINQSLNLTDAIIDDSYSLLHMALQIQIACSQLTEKCTVPPVLSNVVDR